MVAAAVAYVPAVWVIAGIAVALFELLPRMATALAWTAVGLLLVVTMFAESFDWRGRVADLSPVAALLLGVGFAGFRRRDLATG